MDAVNSYFEPVTVTMFDGIVHDMRFLPYWGWHNDHKNFSRTPDYLPAMQQNREEFHEFAKLLTRSGLRRDCLQLGLGYSGASHIVFKSMFYEVTTIELDQTRVDNFRKNCGNIETIIVGNTHDQHTLELVKSKLPYGVDLLFIDAAHTFDDVGADFSDYAPLVRPGGMIALHDALDRNGYEVHRFVDTLRSADQKVTMIGDELGIAIIRC